MGSATGWKSGGIFSALIAKEIYHLSAVREIVNVCATQGNGIDYFRLNFPRVGIFIDFFAANKTA
ncbi:MAG: hypothetical protein WBL95_17195 [Microcoleus sp.]